MLMMVCLTNIPSPFLIPFFPTFLSFGHSLLLSGAGEASGGLFIPGSFLHFSFLAILLLPGVGVREKVGSGHFFPVPSSSLLLTLYFYLF